MTWRNLSNSELSKKVEALQNMLVAHATGGSSDDVEYRKLRREFMNNPRLKDKLPRFLHTCRDTFQFWQFIKYEYAHYSERREFLWNEFRPCLELLERSGGTPADQPVSELLAKFDTATVHEVWLKALERRADDPEGAITAARTLLETVCKHVLDDCAVQYRDDSDLPGLYKMASKQLNLAPSQHSEEVFRQILGGCTSVVEGLGAMRNRLSDAHGKGRLRVRPAPRHAELAVNLAGAMATFLVATWMVRKSEQQEALSHSSDPVGGA